MAKKNSKDSVNNKHIELYGKALNVLEFLLTEFEHDIKYAEFEYLDIPKNTIATIDFIISAIGKVQKGQRLALGLDDDVCINEEPVINVVEGLSEEKIWGRNTYLNSSILHYYTPHPHS